MLLGIKRRPSVAPCERSVSSLPPPFPTRGTRHARKPNKHGRFFGHAAHSKTVSGEIPPTRVRIPPPPFCQRGRFGLLAALSGAWHTHALDHQPAQRRCPAWGTSWRAVARRPYDPRQAVERARPSASHAARGVSTSRRMRDTRWPISQQNVEVVERVSRPRHDVTSTPPCSTSPGVGCVIPGEYRVAGTWRGLDGVRGFAKEWLEAWEAFHVKPEEFIDGGDAVVTQVRYWGRGRGSGVE